jgi:hypothetical protein
MNAATTEATAKKESHFFVIVNRAIVDVEDSNEEANKIADYINRTAGEQLAMVVKGNAVAAKKCKQPASYVDFAIRYFGWLVFRAKTPIWALPKHQLMQFTRDSR